MQEPCDEVVYYHVELPSHDVILAEGLPCETYLDTGNRSAFENGGAAVMKHPDFALGVWKVQACAELVVGGPCLEHVKRLVLARAEALGHRMRGEPGLCVMADGRRLNAVVAGTTWRVEVPSGVRRVRLLSRSFVPSQLLADASDTRPLGVAIGDVCLDGKALPLGDAAFRSGWYTPESQWRWTNGDAVLDVTGARDLAFDILVAGNMGSGGTVAHDDGG